MYLHIDIYIYAHTPVEDSFGQKKKKKEHQFEGCGASKVSSRRTIVPATPTPQPKEGNKKG